MVQLNSGFQDAKEFLRKIFRNLSTRPPKILVSPVLGRRSLKNIVLGGAKFLACPGRQIKVLPRAPTCLGPALFPEPLITVFTSNKNYER